MRLFRSQKAAKTVYRRLVFIYGTYLGSTMSATLPAPLTGIFPPLVTPMTNRDTLDLVAFERLIEHVIAGGVEWDFLPGDHGEGPGLGRATSS